MLPLGGLAFYPLLPELTIPGQMIPEHRHLGGSMGYGPKMETWLVRYGSVQLFGEYQAVGYESFVSDMAPQQRPWGYGQPLPPPCENPPLKK